MQVTDGLTKAGSTATRAGTAALANAVGASTSFFREFQGLWVSSIGLGTGNIGATASPAEVEQTVAATKLAIANGVNLIDLASVYGYGAAETLLGRCLSELIDEGVVTRSALVLCSKAGYWLEGRKRFHETYVQGRKCVSEDLVDETHCVAPEYLRDQIRQSCDRLKMDSLDLYLLHNPEEQMTLGSTEFSRRMHAAFELLEELADAGRISYYGVATAEGFRLDDPGPHRLDALLRHAREVAGGDSRFRVIQAPLNLATTEILFKKNHATGNGRATLLEVAASSGVAVITTVSANGGRTSSQIPERLRAACPKLESEVQVALQFARSAPGVLSALVSMRSEVHVRENLQVREVEPLDLTSRA
jgi:aryl-alcohol dehydrogenase-like predicted oxidoreductase